jgi:fibronectin-binding autotransporter adhesin
MARLGQWLSRRGSQAAEPALRPSGAMALERRIAFDAAIAETVQVTVGPADVCDPAADHDPATTDLSHKTIPDTACTATDSQPAAVSTMDMASVITAARTEIIFIDNRVTDVATLIRGLNNPGAEVVLLDANRDGVQQIADALAGRTGIDAIHILSHGAEGELRLGASLVTTASMNGQYAADLARIGLALSQEADIRIYGCDFAHGSEGEIAVKTLAERTGADIAASTDLTGHASLGGDWDLEYGYGRIDSNTFISAQIAGEYVHILAAPVIDLNGATAGNDVAAAFTENQTNGSTGQAANQGCRNNQSPAVYHQRCRSGKR